MRIPTFHSLIAWLCLLSFGMDFAAHTFIPSTQLSHTSDHEHRDHHHDHHHHTHNHSLHASHHSLDAHNLSASQHLNEHNRTPQDDSPTDDNHDHDLTHHLTVQLRSSSLLDSTLIFNATLPPSLCFIQPSLANFNCSESIHPPNLVAIAHLRSVRLIV